MSLVSSFIASLIVKELEQHFLSHAPELQEAFLKEVSAFIKIVTNWLEEKIKKKGELCDEEKRK